MRCPGYARTASARCLWRTRGAAPARPEALARASARRRRRASHRRCACPPPPSAAEGRPPSRWRPAVHQSGPAPVAQHPRVQQDRARLPATSCSCATTCGLGVAPLALRPWVSVYEGSRRRFPGSSCTGSTGRELPGLRFPMRHEGAAGCGGLLERQHEHPAHGIPSCASRFVPEKVRETLVDALWVDIPDRPQKILINWIETLSSRT